MAPAERCFHCGEPLRGARLSVLLASGPQPVCCAGCAAAAEFIAGCGLESYYRFRTAPAPRPAEAGFAWEAFDRPALLDEFAPRAADGTRCTTLLLTGVRCAACGWLVGRALGELPGVARAELNPVSARLVLDWDPAATPLSALMRRLAVLGYEPHPLDADAGAALRDEQSALLARMAVAGLAAMQTMMYGVALWFGWWQDMPPATRAYLEWVSLLVSVPVVFYSAAPFFQGARAQLVAGRPGMDVPIAVAVALAFAASLLNTARGAWPVYFDSLAMFVFLLLVGRYVEAAARRRAGDAAGALARLLPATATRLDADGPREVGRRELLVHDRVLVRPGAPVPSDAELESAEATLDESLLSGESRPQQKTRGAALIGGSLNLGAPFEARIVRVGAATLAAQIGRLLDRAQAERPRIQQAADRIAVAFVVGVLVLALAVGLAWAAHEPTRALPAVLAVLLATCPCALGLATPAALASATAALARRGVLVTRARAFDGLATATDVVFDKTGTLTRGRPELLETIVLRAGVSADEALALASALEHGSEHAWARAFPPSPTAAALQRSVPGAGVEGEVGGRRLRLGTPAFVAELAPAAPSSADDCVLGDAAGPIARFRCHDPLRSDAAATVGALRAAGLRVHLLSGDASAAVVAVAAALDLDDAQARLSPAAKLAQVRALQRLGRRVLVVGDGVNDAPVLAAADASIALDVGAALAQASADSVLLGERLMPVLDAVVLARAARRVVHQNLGWALAYNLAVLPIAATGLLQPWFAALGMSASSLLVVLNALRLRNLPLRHAPAAVPARGALAT